MATETVERQREREGSEAIKSGEVSDVSSLPIPDLRVKGFRGLKDLRVPRLSQVTLIAGKNGVGKTTLLEAIRVFASRFDAGVVSDILRTRREIVFGIDDDGDPTVDFDWESLFWGRQINKTRYVAIGSEVADVELRLSVATFVDIEQDNAEMYFARMQESGLVFKVDTGKGPYRYVTNGLEARRRRYSDRMAPWEIGFPKGLDFKTLGPDVVDDGELAELWDDLIDSGGSKKEVIDSLSKMYVNQVADLDMVGDRSPFGRGGRRAKVHLAERGRPVPLKSLGDGAVRIVGYITAVSQGGNSLVLVDEIENGIHHSIQSQFWRTLIDATARYDTQLIATTHSWDCVEAFARAAVENDEVDCSLIRIGEIDGELWITDYDERDLSVAAEHGIEVR